MTKLEQALVQIKARIKELQTKAKRIEDLLSPAEPVEVSEEVKPKGRRKVNGTI